MRHALAITPEQLAALREPWRDQSNLRGLTMLEGVVTWARPIPVTFPGPGGRVEGYVVTQRLGSGDHRVLVFAEDGDVLARYQAATNGPVSAWVDKHTRRRAT